MPEMHRSIAMMILERSGINVAGRFLKTARPKNEWIDDVEDPESIIRELKEQKLSN